MPRVKLVEIINRTTEPLMGMWDGVPEVIAPGYRREVFKNEKSGEPETRIVPAGVDGKPLSVTVEYYAAEAYKRQHPLMGSADPYSVDARDTDYLLGVEAWGDDIESLEQSDSDELLDRSRMADDRQNVKRVSLVGRKSVQMSVLADRQRKHNRRVAALANPHGMRINHED